MPETMYALSKAERAIQLINEATVRRLQRLRRLREALCGACEALMFEYEPPAFIVVKCRRCGSWNRIQERPPA
jgi:phage FluMu protein Com